MMEGAFILATIGALLGCAAGALWYGFDLVLGTTTITTSMFGGLVLIATVALPLVVLLIMVICEGAQ